MYTSKEGGGGHRCINLVKVACQLGVKLVEQSKQELLNYYTPDPLEIEWWPPKRLTTWPIRCPTSAKYHYAFKVKRDQDGLLQIKLRNFFININSLILGIMSKKSQGLTNLYPTTLELSPVLKA